MIYYGTLHQLYSAEFKMKSIELQNCQVIYEHQYGTVQ